MSKTPSSTWADVYVNVESHLSKVPSIGTDAFTANLIVLFTGVILKTGTSAGACAWVTDAIKTAAMSQKLPRMRRSVIHNQSFVNDCKFMIVSSKSRLTR